MRAPRFRYIPPLLVAFCAAAVFFTGIHWGLPSRSTDAYLMGTDDRAALQLERLTASLPEVDASHGADVVASSPSGSSQSLNQTLEQQARILSRFRLYSDQPDEMITFRALSQMKPGNFDLDPRLYQYGGLWIYGVGAIIKLGTLLGWLASGNRAFFISNPNFFAQFYVVARGYSAAWGVVGAVAMYFVALRASAGRLLATLIALTFIATPVVVDLAHEAKPHLPGAALVLLAALATARAIDQPSTKRAAIAGLTLGAAAGMVLSGMLGLSILPVQWGLSRKRHPQALQCIYISAASALAAFSITNPYVMIHLFHNQQVLLANLGNTTAMYHASGNGGLDAARWLVAATSPVFWLILLIATIAHALGRKTARELPPVVWLIGAPSILALAQFIVTAGGKPGEFGRFGLVPAIGLLTICTWLLARLSPAPQKALAMLLLLGTMLYGGFYEAGFLRDTGSAPSPSRKEISDSLARYNLHVRPRRLLVLAADPAPYNLPPVNLKRWDIVRMPASGQALPKGAVVVMPDESASVYDPRFTPISWANKAFSIRERD